MDPNDMYEHEGNAIHGCIFAFPFSVALWYLIYKLAEWILG